MLAFVRICQFNVVIFEVTGQKLTKFVSSVDESSAYFNLMKSELWSFNPFRNISMPNESVVGQFRRLFLKIRRHDNVP